MLSSQAFIFYNINWNKSAESGTVSVRHRRDGDLGSMPAEDFIRRVLAEIESKSKK